MAAADRTVLHVLPHLGGGGETYVDLLAKMDGYRFDRAYLASSPGTSPWSCRLALRTSCAGGQLRPAARPRRGRGRSLPAPPRAEPLDRHAPRSHLVRRLTGPRRRAAREPARHPARSGPHHLRVPSRPRRARPRRRDGRGAPGDGHSQIAFAPRLRATSATAPPSARHWNRSGRHGRDLDRITGRARTRSSRYGRRIGRG